AWAILGIVTLFILFSAWYLQEPRFPYLLRSVELLLLTFWFLQLGLWIYRVLAIQYRLTTRRLFYQNGYGHPGPAGIPLVHVTRVLIEWGKLERFAKVGRIYVYLDSPASSYVVLKGVRGPEHIAHQIRKHVQRAQ